MALLICAVGGGRRRAAVSGGTAGGIGDVHTVTKQLAHQLDIRGLAAAGAGTGEFKVGLGKLGRFHILITDSILLDSDFFHGIGPVLRFFDLAFQALHGDGSILGQTDIHAAAAAGAVIGRDLKPVGVLAVHALSGNSLKFGGLGRFLSLVQQNGTDSGMGADQCALVALQALGGVPCGDFHGCAALFKLGGACGPGAVSQTVLHHGGYRQAVALLAVHRVHHVPDEVRLVLPDGGVLGGEPAVRDLHGHQLVDAVLDGGVVHVHNGLPLLLEVGLVDGVLHLRDGLVNGDHRRELEEGGLQNRIRAAAQPQLNVPYPCLRDS